jgi:polar amino acid transport system substrate-binding protein
MTTAPPRDCNNPTASLRPKPGLQPGAIPPSSDLHGIVERGYLKVGVRPDTPPFGSVNPETGAFEGFDVDIANLVAEKLFGSPGHVKFRAVTADQRIPLVESDQVDMATAQVTITPERCRHVDFSAVYYLTSSGVLVLKDSPYTKLDDLGGRQVCAAEGTTSFQRILDAQSSPRPVPHGVANPTDCLVALQNGAVEGIVNDEMVLDGMALQDPRTHVVGTKKPFSEPIAVGISYGHPDLVRFVNGVLAEAMRDGRWTSIYDQWLGNIRPANEAKPAPPVPRYRD